MFKFAGSVYNSLMTIKGIPASDAWYERMLQLETQTGSAAALPAGDAAHLTGGPLPAAKSKLAKAAKTVIKKPKEQATAPSPRKVKDLSGGDLHLQATG